MHIYTYMCIDIFIAITMCIYIYIYIHIHVYTHTRIYSARVAWVCWCKCTGCTLARHWPEPRGAACLMIRIHEYMFTVSVSFSVML